MKKRILPISKLVLSVLFVLVNQIALSQVSFNTDTTSGCDSVTVVFTNTSGIGDYYYWDFDDGNNYFGLDTSHTFLFPGAFNVTLMALDSAFNIIGFYQTQITVTGLNVAWSSTDSICPGDEVAFWFDGFGDTYFWDFGDSSTSVSSDPNHAFDSVGTYNVQFILYHSCGAGSDTSNLTIVVDSAAGPESFFGASSYMVCPDDLIQFWAYTVEGVSTFIWDFGDGTIDSAYNPSHSYDSAGIYVVTHTVINGCGNQSMSTDTFFVSDSVPIPFVGLLISPACPGDAIQPQFFGNQTNFSSYVWDFGDGSPLDSSSDPNHAYADTGLYTVTVTVTNGCGFDTTLTALASIIDTAYPVVNQNMFGIAEEVPYCPGDSVIFFFAGTSDNIWYFGDGDSAVAVDTFMVDNNGNQFVVTYVMHAYADTGVYTVSLTLTNGCGNSATDDIQISIEYGQSANADFVWFSPSNGPNYMACEEVQLLGLGGVTYFWDFGDGDTATTTNANYAHTYTSPGTYTIMLAATNGCGSKDTLWQNIVIDGIGVSFSSVIEASCGIANGMATATTAGGVGPFMYMWNDPMMQTSASATGLAGGSYTVVITDSSGCMDSSSITILAAPLPAFTQSSSNPTSCSGTDGTAQVTVTAGTSPYSYLWNDPGTQTNASATGLSAGSYTVIVTDSFGCMDSTSVSLSDPGAPTLLTSSNDVSCNGGSDGTATVTASSGTTPYTYLWDNSQNTATAIALTVGSYSVTVEDAGGCVSSTIVTVSEPSVLSIDSVTSTAVTTNGGNDGTATANVSGATSPYTYAWNTSPAQVLMTATGLTAGTYTVVILDASGCTDSGSVVVSEPPVGIAEVGIEWTMGIVPNPTNGIFKLSITTTNPGTYSLIMTDIIGQVITSGSVDISGEFTVEFDISEEPVGLYFITLTNGANSRTMKLVHY